MAKTARDAWGVVERLLVEKKRNKLGVVKIYDRHSGKLHLVHTEVLSGRK